MIKFRQKEYTLQEGHYTGPKDMEKIPGALEVIGKSALGGSAIGAVAGSVMKDTTLMEGAITGAKWGSLGGIVAKLFINYLHKPMTKIKYQEVDRSIRRQFGVYQLAGITVGDNLDRRARIDDKFSFNDRQVDNYKLNFAIHDNQVTMYTFGLTDEELDKINKSLDYYCKKFFSMEYTSKIINQRVNSYSVDITFTNYQVICQFIIELANSLNCKINLLDSAAIVGGRLLEAAERSSVDEEKNFSVSNFNKYDLTKLMGQAIQTALKGGNATSIVISTLLGALHKLVKDTAGKMGKLPSKVLTSAGDYNNVFLEHELKKLHYVDGFNYTTGDKKADVQISLISGLFVITCTKDVSSEIDKNLWNSLKSKIHRTESGKVVVYYSYVLKDVKELELVLNLLMKTGLKPNIYEKKARFKLFSSKMTDKLIERLGQMGVVDYEVSDQVPKDVISITSDPRSVKIYIPEDMEDSQYDLEDCIRGINKFVRSQVTTERGFFVMKLVGMLTLIQLAKVIEHITDEEGFCTILDL